MFFCRYMKCISTLPEHASGTAAWEAVELQPNEVIREIYRTGKVELADGTKKKISSAVSPAEGYILYSLIKLNRYKNIVEVGCANGMSALYMTQALSENKKGCLVSIDPFQLTQWGGAGVRSIKRAGTSGYHRLIQLPSYEAFPQLLGSKMDMVFVDGMHLFDYTLIDIFYAALVCRPGGCIVIDDILHAGVSKAIKYIDLNYPHLQRIRDVPTKTMAIYLVLGKDDRRWDFHRNF